MNQELDLAVHILARLVTLWDVHECSGADPAQTVEALCAYFLVDDETLHDALEGLKAERWIIPAAGSVDCTGPYTLRHDGTSDWWDGSAYVISETDRAVVGPSWVIRRHFGADQ